METSIEKIPAFISVRSISKRFPKKCFLPFGKFSVLEHIIKRVQHYGLDPIICTTLESTDDEIVELAIKCDVKYFRGPNENKLLRWSKCCEYFRINSFHSVDADDPFFCGEEVRRSYSLLKSGFDMVAPSPSSSGGGATVGYSLTADVVKRASEMITANQNTEMMWSFVEKVPGLKKIIMDDPVDSTIHARVTLDFYEDYIFLEAIRLIVGNFASREQVFNVIENNPDLTNINAFRTEEWSINQKNNSIK